MASRRRMFVLPLVVVALLAVAKPATAAAACQGANALPTAANVKQVRSAVLCLVNRERTKRGLGKLRPDSKLARAATRHSRDMVRRRYFDHVSPGGGTMRRRIGATGWMRGARSYAFAENIAWGTGDSAGAATIVRAWMDSPGHRRNILTARYRQLGVGIALGAPQGGGGATYTTNFGAKG